MVTARPPEPRPGLPTFGAGAVTGGRGSGGSGLGSSGSGGPVAIAPPPAWPAPTVITRPSGRRALLWYGSAAGLVLIGGLVLILVMLLNGQLGSGKGPLSSRPDAPTDVRPPLARLCPAPTVLTDPSTAPVPAPPPGPRTTDEDAGISYAAYGDPWKPWNRLWRMGTLSVPYGVGQHFVTETYWNGDYEASILSAAVPAAVNDSTAIDLVCTGQQVAADVRAEYYPQPNTRDLIHEGSTTLGGRPAWVTEFRLHFDEDGLRATSELVAVALIDVGRPTAAVLYVSIPNTHSQWDHVVDEVLQSVRPT